MKVIGLITEYNPFHKGHKIHIKKAKSLEKDSVLVCVMSPNFVQRGEVAIEPKEKRVSDALRNGIDLIVELPTIYAVESADIFARSALYILNSLKVTDIIFGSETGDTEAFLTKYNLNGCSSPRIDEVIKEYLEKGYSYPKAYSLANLQIHDFYLENPNDILGFQYVKTINENKYGIMPHTYYRENNEKNKFSTSALAIRTKLKKYRNNHNKFNFLDNYFDLVKHLLLTKSPEELNEIHMMEEGIENYLIKNIKGSKNMDEFIKLCTSKRYSSARIKRTICHLLLNTSKEDAKKYLASNPPYIRVLGYNNKGQDYLKSLRNKNINIITRFSARDNPLLRDELKATSVYYFNQKEPNKTKLIEKEKTAFPIKR